MKIKENLKHVEKTFRSYLGLNHHLVGVKLLKDGNDAEKHLQPNTPMAFCHMMRLSSTRGSKFLYSLEYERSLTAQVALGLRNIRHLKLSYRTVPPETRNIFISPLNENGIIPDVVLAIISPKKMMDLATIIHAIKNKPVVAEFTGKHAYAEFFVRPYLDGEPGISFLCGGARQVYSDYRDDEIIFGAPLEVYVQTAKTMERISKMGGKPLRLSDKRYTLHDNR